MAEPAPLTGVPVAPVPAGAEAAWVAAGDGAKLRAALFRPKGYARGSVVLSGGRTEPIEKYFETIGDFTARGFVVLAHDWRGQGLSARILGDRLKGHARGYNAFLTDFRILLDAYQDRLPRPWYAVGHSMGGCLTLLAMANGEARFAGAALCAPMLGVRTGKVSVRTARTLAGLNVLAGRAGRYTQGQPGKPFDDTFEGNVLTHDRTRFARHRAQVAANPDLALGAPTYGWLDFAFRATAFLARPERLRTVTAPVVIVSAEDDKLVDNAAQMAAARNLPQGRFINVPGAYHEILMETDDMRNIFLRAFDALTGKAQPKASAAAPKPAAAPTPAPAQAAAPKSASTSVPATVPASAAAKAPAAAKKPVAKKPTARKLTAKKATAPKTAAPKPIAKSASGPKPKGGAAKPKPAPKVKVAPRSAAATKPKVTAKASAPKAAVKPVASKAAGLKPAKAVAASKPAKANAPAAKKPARKPAAKKPT